MSDKKFYLIALAVSLLFCGWVGLKLPYNRFWETDTFWQTGLPAWMQGVGTLGAMWIAGYAFYSWRYQEREKRVADIAEELLRAFLTLCQATNSYRTPHPYYNDDLAIEIRSYLAAMDYRIPNLVAFNKSDIVILLELAKASIGEHIAEDIAKAIMLHENVMTTYQVLRDAQNTTIDMSGDSPDETFFVTMLQVVGRVRERIPTGGTWFELSSDVVGQELLEIKARVIKGLGELIAVRGALRI